MSILQVSRLQKNYGNNKIIKEIDFQINEGDCVALLGPNGAGKTTIIKMLINIAKPSAGKILFQGENLAQRLQCIGYLPQHPTFYSWMTGKELLNFIGGLSNLEKKTLDHRMNELLDLVGLSKAKNKRIGTYSGGMKQRLGIAQALIHQPKLLIMDEPVSALDPIGRRDMLELLKVVKQKSTVLFSTHLLYDAEKLCDKILILNRGELLVNSSIDQMFIDNQQPIFIIQAPRVSEWAPQLNNENIVESIEQTGSSVRVRVKNIDQGRTWLLESIVRLKLSVQKFELVQESLEEIFLRMVK